MLNIISPHTDLKKTALLFWEVSGYDLLKKDYIVGRDGHRKLTESGKKML